MLPLPPKGQLRSEAKVGFFRHQPQQPFVERSVIEEVHGEASHCVSGMVLGVNPLSQQLERQIVVQGVLRNQAGVLGYRPAEDNKPIERASLNQADSCGSARPAECGIDPASTSSSSPLATMQDDAVERFKQRKISLLSCFTGTHSS